MISRERLYKLMDMTYSLDGNFPDRTISKSDRLRILNECDSEGKFVPTNFVPYGKDIKDGQFFDWMPTALYAVKAKEGRVAAIIFESDEGAGEELSFSEWASLGKPRKIKVVKRITSVK